MKRKNKLLAMALAESVLPVWAAGEARWISYPGDYGIWWGNELQSQRLQWGSRLTPFWPMYEPHTRVLFRKDNLDIREDEELEVRCDGHAAVCYWTDRYGYVESSAIDGKFVLPKGARGIEIKIQNTARPPSVWVKGKTLVSDGTWNAGWTTTWDKTEDVPVDSSARFTDPTTPPGLAKLPVKEKLPVATIPLEGPADGFTLAADFGEETYGYLKLRDVKGAGKVKVIYAESEAELKAFDLANTKAGALDGWEMLDLSGTAEFRREIAHGFRYVSLRRVSGDVTVGSMAMDYEWKDVPVRGSFRCSDPEINRIWDVSVHTLELTCREVFIEGVKRDHWVWSGDAVQSFLTPCGLSRGIQQISLFFLVNQGVVILARLLVGRVLERFGEQVEKELRYNIKAKEIETTVVDENGKEKKVKETVDVAGEGWDPSKYSPYARVFDEGHPSYMKDAEQNRFYLLARQAQANDRLKSRGHLFLNEVYEMLGFPLTKAGAVVGWIYDPKEPIGDNFVDFGIYEVCREKAVDFANGYERSFILDFNVVGDITDALATHQTL